jgi:hypothetical protein
MWSAHRPQIVNQAIALRVRVEDTCILRAFERLPLEMAAS